MDEAIAHFLIAMVHHSGFVLPVLPIRTVGTHLVKAVADATQSATHTMTEHFEFMFRTHRIFNFQFSIFNSLIIRNLSSLADGPSRIPRGTSARCRDSG